MMNNHQVFISYCKEDIILAQAVYKQLTEDNFNCFFDKESLRAGDDWDDKIQEYLMASNSLIILMSKNAKNSNWVSKEYHQFAALINIEKNNHRVTQRRIIFVLLDYDDLSYNRWQKITDIMDSGKYLGPGSVVQKDIWSIVINKIERAARADQSSLPVSHAVLALTKDRFNALYHNNTEEFATRVNNSLFSLGIDCNDPVKLNSFINRYGDEATDWKPFDGSESIEEILKRVERQLNNRILSTGRSIYLDKLGEQFYSASDSNFSDELQQIKQRMKSEDGLFALIIDPISLFDSKIIIKLGLLDSFFEDDRTTVLVLTPITLDTHIALTGLIKEAARAFFNRFYEDIREKYAHCGVNVCDERDIQRIFQVATGSRIYSQIKHRDNPFARHG